MQPKDKVKVLGVLMDSRLKYKQHIVMAASKGLEAAMQLKRLKGLSTATARQLFTATVVPAVDYASNVWMHKVKSRLVGPLNRVQRTGAQAIVGTFMTVATAIAETEAHIASVEERLQKRVIKLWIDMHTLPTTNPLRRLTTRMRKCFRTFRSPLYQSTCGLSEVEVEKLETIQPFTLAPWTRRMHAVIDDDEVREGEKRRKIRIAVSSSGRNDLVGVGGVIELPPPLRESSRLDTFFFTLGMRAEQNPYSGALAAIAYALRCLPELQYYDIEVMTNNKSAALTLRKPWAQSAQQYIQCIYDSVEELRLDSNTTTIVWTPAGEDNENLLTIAKRKARKATSGEALPEKEFPMMRSTVLNLQKRNLRAQRRLPDKVDKYTKRIDLAVPGTHTRDLYDKTRSWKEASVLAQLRTDMSCLNESLYRIRAVPSGQCECGQARETVDHYLFSCTKWTAQRTEMLQCTDTRRGNISFFLGGKTRSDDKRWKPNLDAVRATIRFARATGRFERT